MIHSWELCFPFQILYRNSRRWSFYSNRTTLSLSKSNFVNQMRASLSIDLRHDHITSSDCFSLSIPPEVLKVSTLVIDTFGSWVLSLSHSQSKKDVDKAEQSQRRTATMIGAGLFALQAKTGGSGLLQPGERVVVGGLSSSCCYLRAQHQGNGYGWFIAMRGWRMRNSRPWNKRGSKWM